MENTCPALAVPVGQAPLDPGLARAQPVQHGEHLMARHRPEIKHLAKTGGRGVRCERPRGGGFRCRINDTRHNGRNGQIPHPFSPAPESAHHAQRAHGAKHRRNMAVRQRPPDGDRGLN